MIRLIQLLEELNSQKKTIDRRLFGTNIVDPIPVIHRRPKSLDHVRFSSLASDADRELFLALTGFADRINMIFEDEPWRLQESENADLNLLYSDGPALGSVYEIFYNKMKVGRLEVEADLLEEGCTSVTMRINDVRLLPYKRVWGLIYTICLYICDGDKQELRNDINEAFLEALWEPDITMIGATELDFSRSGGSYENWKRDKS